MGKFLNMENFNKYLNFLRPWNYLGHPKLKLKNPKNKKEMLLAMRDLRLWIIENAPFSSRRLKAVAELEHLNRELSYLQFRGFFVPLFFWVGIYLYVRFGGSGYWRGPAPLVNRPVIAQQTGGSSAFHDGSVPKFEGSDFTDITGGL